MLARREAVIAAKLKAEYDAQLSIALQMGLDAATIAANEVLGMGKGRAKEFLTKYIETYNLFARMITEDSGEVAQINIVLEEMSELQKELCKYLRGMDNQSEIAEECDRKHTDMRCGHETFSG